MNSEIVNMDIYLTKSSQELTTLADSPFQRKDGNVVLDRIAELVVDLTEKNSEDIAAVNTAIFRGLGRLATEDHTQALNVTANAAESAPKGSKLEMELIERWTDLMIGKNLEHRSQLFPFAQRAFEDSQKPAFKAAAASEVVDLVAYAASNHADLKSLQAILQAVQKFGFETENLDIANRAGPKIAAIKDTILFSSPAYAKK